MATVVMFSVWRLGISTSLPVRLASAFARSTKPGSIGAVVDAGSGGGLGSATAGAAKIEAESAKVARSEPPRRVVAAKPDVDRVDFTCTLSGTDQQNQTILAAHKMYVKIILATGKLLSVIRAGSRLTGDCRIMSHVRIHSGLHGYGWPSGLHFVYILARRLRGRAIQVWRLAVDFTMNRADVPMLVKRQWKFMVGFLLYP
ncbi:hypothetical protein AB0J35_59185 [Nonomuraea angiospora]|uniref:hypothetical protein n=1 Tax=Nonomuraea angiospora TaxID=46172 RepID=UPI00343F2178